MNSFICSSVLHFARENVKHLFIYLSGYPAATGGIRGEATSPGGVWHPARARTERRIRWKETRNYLTFLHIKISVFLEILEIRKLLNFVEEILQNLIYYKNVWSVMGSRVGRIILLKSVVLMCTNSWVVTQQMWCLLLQTGQTNFQWVVRDIYNNDHSLKSWLLNTHTHTDPWVIMLSLHWPHDQSTDFLLWRGPHHRVHELRITADEVLFPTDNKVFVF